MKRKSLQQELAVRRRFWRGEPGLESWTFCCPAWVMP